MKKETNSCVFCRKKWPVNEADKYVVIDGILMCKHHHGVSKMYEEAEKAAKKA